MKTSDLFERTTLAQFLTEEAADAQKLTDFAMLTGMTVVGEVHRQFVKQVGQAACLAVLPLTTPESGADAIKRGHDVIIRAYAMMTAYSALALRDVMQKRHPEIELPEIDMFIAWYKATFRKESSNDGK
jgi:hypothetical protein